MMRRLNIFIILRYVSLIMYILIFASVHWGCGPIIYYIIFPIERQIGGTPGLSMIDYHNDDIYNAKFSADGQYIYISNYFNLEVVKLNLSGDVIDTIMVGDKNNDEDRIDRYYDLFIINDSMIVVPMKTWSNNSKIDHYIVSNIKNNGKECDYAYILEELNNNENLEKIKQSNINHSVFYSPFWKEDTLGIFYFSSGKTKIIQCLVNELGNNYQKYFPVSHGMVDDEIFLLSCGGRCNGLILFNKIKHTVVEIPLFNDSRDKYSIVDLSVSPSGKYIVYESYSNYRSCLWIKDIKLGKSSKIFCVSSPGLECAECLIEIEDWSWDSKKVLISVENKLCIIELDSYKTE